MYSDIIEFIQPLTFIATANAISYCGAHPVFIDVDRNTMRLSPAKMREWLLKNAADDNGAMTRPVWQLMNRLPMFESCQHGDLNNAEWFEERVVNLPSSVRVQHAGF